MALALTNVLACSNASWTPPTTGLLNRPVMSSIALPVRGSA
jgi:hypothetical protein